MSGPFTCAMVSESRQNIILIGMCGVGKSTIGVLLAKATGLSFIDTDVCLQTQSGMPLQKIIERIGVDAFCRIEERFLLDIPAEGLVVATGGSSVYSETAMTHAAATGTIVHLDLDLATIERRVADPYARGVVIEPGQTLAGLFAKRQPLYKRFAGLNINCAGKTHEQIVHEIVSGLSSQPTTKDF